MKIYSGRLASFALAGSLVMSAAFFAPAQAADQQASGHVSASDCWVRLLPAAVPSGGFLKLTNTADKPAMVTSVSSPAYAEVMMHQTTETDGISKMSMVDELTIPAGGSLALEPGSYHLMLEKPSATLAVGDSITLEFTLSSGQSFTTECELKSPKSMPGMMHDHDHGHGADDGHHH